MGGLGAKKEELVPKRSALRKEKGAWKAEGEDPGCRKDLESGGRSQRSESCVEMNASDAKGWYPKAVGNRPNFLHDCPGAARASWREGEPSAAGRARVSTWNNQVGRKLSSCWSSKSTPASSSTTDCGFLSHPWRLSTRLSLLASIYSSSFLLPLS